MGSVKINGVEFKTVEKIRNGDKLDFFIENRIVSAVLNYAERAGGYDMNAIWRDYRKGDFTLDEMREFYRLIGYSVSGFGEVFEGPETLLNDETAEDFPVDSEDADQITES